MWNKSAKFALLLLIPACALANQKEKGTAKVQVVTARTKIHGSSSGNMFSYTNLMFAEVNGKKVVYECAEPGDICPVLESGRTYVATQDGAFVYLPLNAPAEKKELSVRFKQVGNW
jgi:uncharacterized protein (AIM24 family)